MLLPKPTFYKLKGFKIINVTFRRKEMSESKHASCV